ncbi:hypothetical protein [Halorubellus sp. PRR65]|uniref:hypothetical protein n=1 Tax=Halorubellus sp. PRR65 TaxID=3098148 RepID=UPI002B25EC3F|nr:hypothetical protein [Halorubellus sp. PRR65]
MNRLSAAAGVLLVGVLLLGAGLAPSFGCDRTSALETTAAPDGDAPVANASVLPDDVRETFVDAVESDGQVNVTRAVYQTHLEDRRVRYDGSTYATSLRTVETCGGVLEDAFVVLGSALSALGGVALVLFALYRDDLGPPLGVLHVSAAAALVLGVALFAGGVAAPAGCVDNYALDTTEIPGGENATDERVVDASTLPLDLVNATERSVTSNQTAFVDRGAFREHLENRSVRFGGAVYDADVVLVQDCGGGLDDALLVVGLAFATLGAVALSLLVTFDHGEKVL